MGATIGKTSGVSRCMVQSCPHALQWIDTITSADVFDSTRHTRPLSTKHFGHGIGERQSVSAICLIQGKDPADIELALKSDGWAKEGS